MTLPVRRRAGRPAELEFPRWAGAPLREFEDLFNRMERLLETTFGPASLTEMGAWAPMADLSETDEAYLVEVDLPGIKSDDLDVEISERELHITGELKEREREGVLRHGTRRTGRFEYRALLPGEVKAENVSATLADGVLSVTVPKAEPAKPRHIEITTGD